MPRRRYSPEIETGTEHYLSKRECVLVLVIIFLGIISFGLLAGLLSHKCATGKKTDDFCTRPDCVFGAASLLHTMNQSNCPCKDFYSFACDGYIKKTPVMPGTAGTEVLTSKGVEINLNIKEFIERADVDKVPTAVSKAVEMYAQCVNYDDTSQNVATKDLAALLEEFGGWPVAMPRDEWHPKNKDDFAAFLASVTRRGFETQLIDISLMPDLTNSSSVKITVIHYAVHKMVFPPGHTDISTGIGYGPAGLNRTAIPEEFYETVSDEKIVWMYHNGSANARLTALDQPKGSAHRLSSTLFRRRRETELPNPTNEDEEQYWTFVKSIAALLGFRDSDSVSSDIYDMLRLKMELKKIATASDDRMNYTKMYNTFSLSELHNETNTKNVQFNWIGVIQKLFAGITHISETEDIIMVMDVDFVVKLPGVLHKYSQRTITNYVIYEGIISAILSLYESQLSTLSEDIRWSKCLENVNGVMPFAVTRLFIENQDFDVQKTIVEAEAMISGIQEAFKETFEENGWLDAHTKAEVPRKVDKMKKFVGFPNWILDDEKLNEHYDDVEVASSPLQTLVNVLGKETMKALRQFRNPKLKESWTMDPATVNAQYELLSNTIWVPIGILTPPVFDSNYLAAMNFGAIGSIIGHEIGHGFDNEGNQFDEQGNLRQWWSDYSLRAYENKTQCFLSQYSKYCPASFQPEESSGEASEPVCLDGVNTLAENVADNIGVQASFKAYKNWQKAHGTEPRLPGLKEYNPDQIFFISFARMWCENYREDQMKQIYTVDNRSPGRYRVMGTMSNFPEFAKTFGCSSGPMVRPDKERCSLY